VEPERVQFGNLSAGETQTQSIVVKNLLTSNRSLVVNETSITGRHPGEFAVVNNSGAPFTLEPGESKRIYIEFTPQSTGEKQAQLQIVSNAEVSQIDVWLSNTGAYLVVQEVGIDRDTENKTVNIDGKFIRQNSNYLINISRPTLESLPAKITETNMTVTRAGNFSMNITHSPNPVRAGTAVTQSERTALQYVSVDYTVSSRTFNETSFVFTIDKSALPAGTGPDEIAFERYSGGQWRSQNVRLIGESDSMYRFRVTTNGYSQFVITGPTTASNERSDGGHTDCEVFGIDYGSFVVCWYWWFLAATTGLLLVLYRVRHRDVLGQIFRLNHDEAGGDDDE
jgi:hypothetical protein